MKRGQVYLCDLEPRKGHEQGSTRPVIVVSANLYNASGSPLIGIVPLTSAAAKNPLHVVLDSKETGLRQDSTALVDHLRFIDRERLLPKIAGSISEAAMERIDANLKRVLALR